MKRTLIAVVGIFIAASPVRADYQKGNQSLQFSLGPVGYSDDVKVNNGDDTLRNCGGVGGIQYLYYMHSGPTLAVGPDILWSDLSEKDPSTVLPNSVSHGAEHTAIYQGVMKLSYSSGHFRPYLLGGMGASRSSLQGDITPASGSPVQTFDSIRYGFAGTWGLGFNFFPREHWFFGLELRQSIISRLLHEPTSAGQALGIQPVRDPSSITALMLNMGYKFGAK
jgi:opacity protein-like surface antigen